jgi:hypothetical protein
MSAKPFYRFHGTRPVRHHITKAPEVSGRPHLGIEQKRVERHDVPVTIREDRDAHAPALAD